MVTTEIVDVLFVISPYADDMTVPRAFVLRIPPDGMTELNEAIETGLIRKYRVPRIDSGAEYVAAAATRSRYGFIQLEPF
jgi:hypothetical protein